MKTTRTLSASGSALSAAILMAFASSAHATEPLYPDLTTRIYLNVSSLETNTNGPFSLDFQLIPGSGGVTNTVTLSNFTFTGGTVGANDFETGAVTGSMSSSIVLTNTDMDNEISQYFSSGVSQIAFTVDETRNSDLVGSGTATPDQFNVAILDSGLNNIPTTDPSNGNTLVSSQLISSETPSQIGAFTSDGDDSGVSVTVPEPGTPAMFLTGAFALLGIFGLRRYRNA